MRRVAGRGSELTALSPLAWGSAWWRKGEASAKRDHFVIRTFYALAPKCRHPHFGAGPGTNRRPPAACLPTRAERLQRRCACCAWASSPLYQPDPGDQQGEQQPAQHGGPKTIGPLPSFHRLPMTFYADWRVHRLSVAGAGAALLPYCTPLKKKHCSPAGQVSKITGQTWAAKMRHAGTRSGSIQMVPAGQVGHALG